MNKKYICFQENCPFRKSCYDNKPLPNELKEKIKVKVR